MTRRDLLLHLLREAGERGVTTGELLHAGVGSRYGTRLLELREAGYVIAAERVRDGSWRYTLTDEPGGSDVPAPVGPEQCADGSSPATSMQAAGTSEPAALFDAPTRKPQHAINDDWVR